MSYRAIVVLALAAFASATALRATDPLLPLLADSFGTTAGGASAVITAFGLAYGLLQVVNGPIADRIGKYRMVFWVTAISAAGNLACALAPSLPLLAAARFATGATVGAIVPLAMAWIGDTVPYDRRQSVLARFLIGHMTGIALSSMLSGWLGERHGWQAVFYALAALYVAIAALLWFELKTNPATTLRSDGGQTLREAFLRMAGLTRDRWTRVVLATVFFEGLLLYGAFAFVATDVHRRFGLSLAQSGAVLSVFALGGMLYALAAARLLKTLGEGRVALGGGLMAGAGYLGLAFAPAAAYVVPCALAIGTGLYMLHNTLQVHATQMAPNARGAAVALFACFLFTGQSSGVWLASHAVDGIGTLPVFLVAAAGLPLLAWDFGRRLAAHRLR